ncbi:hypothetical protein OK016_23540 [Vibrio chagasii]|nr:hypothetical protein [Vibrio chagasii]
MLFSKSYIDTINSIEGIDEKTKERVAFFSSGYQCSFS